jgi:uncharacterized protein
LTPAFPPAVPLVDARAVGRVCASRFTPGVMRSIIDERPGAVVRERSMDYFFYCRDKAGSAAARQQIVEQHWGFMDGFEPDMAARGPTLAGDGTPTGSMHIVNLPDRAAAEHFAYDEPYAKAGVYDEIFFHRWNNALGRTMWEFAGDKDGPKFLMFATGKPGMTETRQGLLEDHRAYFRDNGYLERFVFRGPLQSDDGSEWLGSAMAIQLPDRAAVDEMLAGEPYVCAGLYDRVEVHPWRFGGRK